VVAQLVTLEGASATEARWFTFARTVRPQAARGAVTFAIGLGLDAKLAATLTLAQGVDLADGAATQIGLGCRACTVPDCPQRAHPPHGRVLVFNERERGVSPFSFAGD
jgi:predicted transcriptional regulator